MDLTVSIGCGPLPVTVTNRIMTFLVGDPYKPPFPTVTGRGPRPKYTSYTLHPFPFEVIAEKNIEKHLITIYI